MKYLHLQCKYNFPNKYNSFFAKIQAQAAQSIFAENNSENPPPFLKGEIWLVTFKHINMLLLKSYSI